MKELISIQQIQKQDLKKLVFIYSNKQSIERIIQDDKINKNWIYEVILNEGTLRIKNITIITIFL